MSQNPYNRPPKCVGIYELSSDDIEMMCYLYLPIKLPGQKDWHSLSLHVCLT